MSEYYQENTIMNLKSEWMAVQRQVLKNYEEISLNQNAIKNENMTAQQVLEFYQEIKERRQKNKMLNQKKEIIRLRLCQLCGPEWSR